MKKPRVIQVEKNTLVKDCLVGRYWIWWGSNDSEPKNIHMKWTDSFKPGFTYQEYEGEIPKFPTEKTDKEKLTALIEATEKVFDFCDGVYWLRVPALKTLLNELKEKP